MTSSWQSWWTLARKDLALLLRDRRSALLLLVMPIIFILVLGMALGETFGQKPDERLRITVVDLDAGMIDRQAAINEAAAWMRCVPIPGAWPILGTLAWTDVAHQAQFPFEPWSKVVLRDLAETA